jgi:GT2 family glycosyltransferase
MLANVSDYECINARQFDVRDLVNLYPETMKYFTESDFVFTDFDSRPWDYFRDYSPILSIEHMKLLDIQNLCLYKKSIFEKVGYTDVNFYPAYFVDNDYARRLVNSGIRCCSLSNARFFHFWSRTIKQEVGGSNGSYFDNNKKYYMQKWGGEFAQETIVAPTLISSRDNEETMIDSWRQ